MSSSKNVSKVPNVSKQFTKMIPVSTKFEWRIENFQKAMRFYKCDESISSETFTLPMTATWKLSAYPLGTTEHSSGYPCFFLHLIGLQAPEGSSSSNNAKSIMADYKIYLLSRKSGKGALESEVKQGLSEFKIGTTAGSWMYETAVNKSIHPDGSLLVICEVESLAPGKNISLEPTPNPGMLDANLHLSNRFREMWKSKLYTDCTLKVGGKSFPAHKCILVQWSEVFRNMFSLPTEEAESGVVEIKYSSPDAISAMLEYMYTGLVKTEVMDKLAQDILALADKYAVIPLKETCEVFLASKLTTTNFLQRAMFADRYSAGKLKQACVNRFAKDGPAALQSKDWEELKSKNKDLADELLKLVIKDHPYFAVA